MQGTRKPMQSGTIEMHFKGQALAHAEHPVQFLIIIIT
jgi:hypothetical protein